MCLGSWDRHGSSWYKCNRYNETDSKEARSAQQKSRAALERYLFYCNRYLTHNKSNKLESKLYAMIEYKRHDLEKLDIPQVEVSVFTQIHCIKCCYFNFWFVIFLFIMLLFVVSCLLSHSFLKLRWIHYPLAGEH